MTKRKILAYPLPDNLDPSIVCIRAYVPNAPEYIAAWWQSYEYLAKWVAWEKDNAGSAKTAADAWRYCLERARLDYELSRNCDYIIPPQHDDDGQSELADYLWHWYDILTQAAEFINDGKTISQWRAYVTDTYGVYYSRLADPIFETIEEMIYEDAIDAIDDLPWSDFYFDAWCEYGNSCQDVPFNAIPACYLSEIIDSIVNTLQEGGNVVGAALQLVLDAIFDPGGMGDSGDWAVTIAANNLGNNFNFGEVVCTWEILFDFANDGWSGWTVSEEEGHDNAEYVTGQGIYARNGQSATDNMWRNSARLDLFVPDTISPIHVTDIEICHDMDKGYINASSALAYSATTFLDDIVGYFYSRTYSQLSEGNNVIRYESLDRDCDRIRIGLASSRSSSEVHDLGVVLIKWIRLKGTGINPWG